RSGGSWSRSRRRPTTCRRCVRGRRRGPRRARGAAGDRPPREAYRLLRVERGRSAVSLGESMITCRLYREGMLKEEAFDPTRASDLIVEQGSRVWLDIADPNDGDLELLQEEFSLHPLAIDDARHRNQRPKLEVYDGYFVLAMHAVWLDEGDDLRDSEIHAFAGHRYLITLRYPPVFEVGDVLK